MRTIPIITAVVATACWCSSAVAETPEEKRACIGDAFKMCWSEIPNRHEVYLCLQRNKRQLSQDCRVVMNRHPHQQTAKRDSARTDRDEAAAASRE